MIRFAFRYGDPRFYARAVCWWRGGDVSHCETARQLDGNLHDCISSSYLDDGVRRKDIALVPEKWRIYELPGDWQTAEQWYALNKGKKYDLRGFIAGVVPPAGETRGRLFCSEVGAEIVGLPEPWLFFPREFEAVCRLLGRRIQ